MILLYISDEFSYDRFHEKEDRIYRIAWETDFGVSAFPPLIPIDDLVQEFPQIESGVNLTSARYMVLNRGDVQFTETKFYYASDGFFRRVLISA